MLRSDVSTMKNILKLFTRWSREQNSEDIAEFADWFFGFRFGLPGFDPEQSQVREQIARLALPFYSARTNVDGRPSLLAVLGAISEAERFVVDPPTS